MSVNSTRTWKNKHSTSVCIRVNFAFFCTFLNCCPWAKSALNGLNQHKIIVTETIKTQSKCAFFFFGALDWKCLFSNLLQNGLIVLKWNNHNILMEINLESRSRGSLCLIILKYPISKYLLVYKMEGIYIYIYTLYIVRNILSPIRIIEIRCSSHFHGHRCIKAPRHADCFYKHLWKNGSLSGAQWIPAWFCDRMPPVQQSPVVKLSSLLNIPQSTIMAEQLQPSRTSASALQSVRCSDVKHAATGL